MPQQTNFKNKQEFNEAMRLAHLNDNPYGILANIYDSEYPHPYFDPEKIGFYPYRDWTLQNYTDRSSLPDKTIIFEDYEMYIPGHGDDFHNLFYSSLDCPLKDKDGIMTACITTSDHLWPVPYVYNNYHFVATNEVNRDKIFNQPNSRSYTADMLFGNPKPHRNIFFELLKENSLLEKNLINLFGQYRSEFLNTIDDEIQQALDKAVAEAGRTTGNTSGYINTASHLDTSLNALSIHIHTPVMEASWYSVVAESLCDNNCFFVTEKTAKPLMAGRPFIILSGQYTLKHLRSLGFKTFTPVIDETYDEIKDNTQRIKAAFQSFVKLSSKNPVHVYAQLKDVLDHNQKIMYSKQAITQRARDFLDNYI